MKAKESKVYFAGKIGQYYDNQTDEGWGPQPGHWRDPFLRKRDDRKHGIQVDQPFEIEDGIVYAGPWIASYHGIQEASNDTPVRCKAQIHDCDLVLAWINTPDSYGTILEIGYASALNKPVYIGFEAGMLVDLHINDFWFVRSFAKFSSEFTEAEELYEIVKRHLRYNTLPAPKRTTRKRKVIFLPGPVIDPSECFVYLVREITSDRLKIGTTQDITQRLEQLQIGNPDLLEVVAWLPGSYALEKELHDKFAHLNERGEWYRPDAEIFTVFYQGQPKIHQDEPCKHQAE